MAKLPSYTPSRKEPWDARRARHLLERTGFGATPEEVAACVRRGFEASVRQVLEYEKTPDTAGLPGWLGQPLDLPEVPEMQPGARPDRERLRVVRQAVQRQTRRRVEELRAWWLSRMASTPRPLQEKMTLFWHGHFTTEARKVRSPQLLYQQNEFLRRNATGNFRTLVLGIARDPAMLRYLDNNVNRRGRPNENFARELMELFTMGIGNYTETDVKEAARAFTGWTFGLPGMEGEGGVPRGDRRQLLRLLAGDVTPEFRFRARLHDDGEKSFLGRTGAFEGEAIVDIILEQKATAEYISRKLYAFFAGDEQQPPPEVTAALAETFRASRYELKPVLEAFLRSRAFYADAVIATQIKSPAVLVAGALRQLDAKVTNPLPLNGALRQMGQILFDPPTVKGWDGGRAWINTTTLLARYNFAGALTYGESLGRPGRRGPGRPEAVDGQGDAGMRRPRAVAEVDVTALYDPAKQRTPEEIMDHLAHRLLAAPLDSAGRTELVEHLKSAAGDPETRIRGVIHLLMSTPNYQLC